MWITIIILAYVTNVFLNRWLNKIVYKKKIDMNIMPFMWFLSLFGTLWYLHDLSKYDNWFTGKHW